MYSPSIIDRRLYAAKKSGLPFSRLPRDRSMEISTRLSQLRTDRSGKTIPDNGLSRPLDAKEKSFIDSEMILSKCDFEYWAVRYAKIEVDPGVGGAAPLRVLGREALTSSEGERDLFTPSKIDAVPFLPSQSRLLLLIGRREEECHAEKKKYEFSEGIRVYIHKVRQICATQTWLEMLLHRMIFWPGTRGYAASLDSPRVGELFKRFHLMLDNLPFWMKPRAYPDVKDTEIGFEHPISSRLSFEAENAEHGIGTGSQSDVSGLTEVALWRYPHQIGFSFVPSIPKAITTLHVQESTSNVKGDYWNEVTEAARHKRRGFESFVYCFIPWYMNFQKYRANVPDSWTPEEHTVRHAELITRTSTEFYDGKTVTPTRSQLYWWEGARAQYVRAGELAAFLASYPATPEQSFQNLNAGALPVELIEKMEQRTRMPMGSYEVDMVGSA